MANPAAMQGYAYSRATPRWCKTCARAILVGKNNLDHRHGLTTRTPHPIPERFGQ